MQFPFNSTNNTAIGALTLQDGAAGNDNTAVGSQALSGLVSGTRNTAVGSIALLNPGQGNDNTAIGYSAMGTGGACGDPRNGNTAAGVFALYSNVCGDSNTATGLQALVSNISGNENTALGLNALFSNTTGSRNTALGAGAGGALTTGSDNIVIGNSGVAGDSGKIRTGITGVHTNTYVAGIYGAARSRTSVPLYVDSAGRLGTSTSSARFKEAIKPMEKASEAILALKPVTFRYKHDLDPERIAQFGLVAEEVEKVNPDLVARDEQGKPYTVRYEAVNAMLLNEFLKEHRKVQELEANAANQQKQIDALTRVYRK